MRNSSNPPPIAKGPSIHLSTVARSPVRPKLASHMEVEAYTISRPNAITPARLRRAAFGSKTCPHASHRLRAFNLRNPPEYSTSPASRMESDPHEGHGSPLHYAALNGCGAIAELLIANGADVRSKADDGGTALHVAAKSGHEGFVKLLVESGADVRARDNQGRTVLQNAEAFGHSGVADILRSSSGMLFDVLMDALCCMMVSDRRASRAERRGIHEIMA